jgi:secreted protein with Ig-like and vWFA domain
MLWEQHCLQNAQYFTAVRGRNPSLRIKETFKTLDQAVEYARNNFDGDKKTMIYAVTDSGSHAHICNA